MHLSKPRDGTPRVNHNVNYELQVIMMCPCRFISYNKGTTLVGDDKEGGHACVETDNVCEIPNPCTFPLILLQT